MSESPVVNIIDVIPGAVQVQARTIVPGDSLFDACGGTHPVKSVRVFPVSGVRTIREDGCVDWFAPTDPVTILRATS